MPFGLQLREPLADLGCRDMCNGLGSQQSRAKAMRTFSLVSQSISKPSEHQRRLDYSADTRPGVGCTDVAWSTSTNRHDLVDALGIRPRTVFAAVAQLSGDLGGPQLRRCRRHDCRNGPGPWPDPYHPQPEHFEPFAIKVRLPDIIARCTRGAARAVAL